MNTIENDYDWQEAFKYARKPQLTQSSEPVSLEAIEIDDVDEVYWKRDGEHDGDNWEGIFKLIDGRWLYLTAWCDYTGWG